MYASPASRSLWYESRKTHRRYIVKRAGNGASEVVCLSVEAYYQGCLVYRGGELVLEQSSANPTSPV